MVIFNSYVKDGDHQPGSLPVKAHPERPLGSEISNCQGSAEAADPQRSRRFRDFRTFSRPQDEKGLLMNHDGYRCNMYILYIYMYITSQIWYVICIYWI